MTAWAQPESPQKWTWGHVVGHAIQHGVSIEVLPEVEQADGSRANVLYLFRSFKGKQLGYPMPDACTPSRGIGFREMAAVCWRLRIPEIEPWPINF